MKRLVFPQLAEPGGLSGRATAANHLKGLKLAQDGAQVERFGDFGPPGRRLEFA
jgi:hypothetical protein